MSKRLRNSLLTAILPVAVSCAVTSGSVTAGDPTAPQDVVFDGISVENSLTGMPGNPEEGKKVFANRKLGNCLACHANSDMNDQPFHGEVGPSLDGVGTRYPEPMLRTIVINAKKVFTDETVMPGFYSLEVGQDVRENLIGKTVLSAEQVEDVVAYLATLK